MTLRDFLKIAFRWLLAFALVGLAFAVVTGKLAKGGADESLDSLVSYQTVIPILVGILLLTGGVILVSPELIHWASAPFRAFFEHLFFPGTRAGPPPPDYTLPRFYRKEQRYAEALHWYQRLLRADPQDLDAVLEAMETAFESGNPALARKIHRKAVRKLRDKAARQEVWKRYAALLAETEALSENGVE